MKKQFLLLAGSALIFASCGSNNTNQNNQQAQIDSMAKVNSALQDAANKQKNDSMINAMAKAKADSMEAASKGHGSEHKGSGHKVTKTETAPPPPPPPTKTQQDNKFDNRQPGNQNKPALTPEQQKTQDDKFNRRK